MKVLQISKKWSGENFVCLILGSVVIAAGIAAVVLATTSSSIDSETESRDM